MSQTKDIRARLCRGRPRPEWMMIPDRAMDAEHAVQIGVSLVVGGM